MLEVSAHLLWQGRKMTHLREHWATPLPGQYITELVLPFSAIKARPTIPEMMTANASTGWACLSKEVRARMPGRFPRSLASSPGGPRVSPGLHPAAERHHAPEPLMQAFLNLFGIASRREHLCARLVTIVPVLSSNALFLKGSYYNWVCSAATPTAAWYSICWQIYIYSNLYKGTYGLKLGEAQAISV